MARTIDTMEIRFGAMSPPLSEQLQDVGIDEEDIAHFQQDADAILRLHIRGLMPDVPTDKAFRKLVRNICKVAKPGAATTQEKN